MIDNTCFKVKTSQTLLFVDSGVQDYQRLIIGVVPGVKIIVLEANRDGIEQITETLQRYPECTTLHLLAHGSPGILELGNSELSLDTLEHYSPQLQSWFIGQEKGTLLLYGCKVAQGDAGTEFLEKLHRFTGAAIAASHRNVGSASLGGTWNLSQKIGDVNAQRIFHRHILSTYSGILKLF